MTIPKDFLDPYIKRGKTHSAYDETVTIADHLEFHIDDWKRSPDRIAAQDEFQKQVQRAIGTVTKENPFFQLLIDDRRPGEGGEIRKYRRRIYVNINKQPTNKVISSLKKITRSEDWSIDFSKVDVPNIIPDGEDLQTYIEKKYPMFRSIENWVYALALKETLRDPNGLICVYPTNFNVPENQFLTPFTYFVQSRDVLDYIPGHLAVIRTDLTHTFTEKKTVVKNRTIFVLTQTEIFEGKQINLKGDWELTLLLQHDIGALPAWRPTGEYKEIIDNQPVYDSFLSPMLPRMDEAAREYSDTQAEYVQHVHSTMWYIAGQECKPCKGTGSILSKGDGVQKQGKQITCPTCNGVGAYKKNSYEDIVLQQQKLDDAPIPVPPGGYLEKNVEVPKLMNEHVQEHILAALSAVNMEFLGDVPLNQSGKAKEIDRQELNNFVYSVAFYIVNSIVKPSIFFINQYRYGLLLNEQQAADQLPFIGVPERFDILGDIVVSDQLKLARDGGFDATIVDELEIQYSNAVFRTKPEIAKKVRVIKELDPFSGQTPEEIDNALLAGTIERVDAILHKYINFFVDQAIAEKEGFLDLPFEERLKIVQEKALAKETPAPVIPVEPPPDGS